MSYPKFSIAIYLIAILGSNAVLGLEENSISPSNEDFIFVESGREYLVYHKDHLPKNFNFIQINAGAPFYEQKDSDSSLNKGVRNLQFLQLSSSEKIAPTEIHKNSDVDSSLDSKTNSISLPDLIILDNASRSLSGIDTYNNADSNSPKEDKKPDNEHIEPQPNLDFISNKLSKLQNFGKDIKPDNQKLTSIVAPNLKDNNSVSTSTPSSQTSHNTPNVNFEYQNIFDNGKLNLDPNSRERAEIVHKNIEDSKNAIASTLISDDHHINPMGDLISKLNIHNSPKLNFDDPTISSRFKMDTPLPLPVEGHKDSNSMKLDKAVIAQTPIITPIINLPSEKIIEIPNISPMTREAVVIEIFPIQFAAESQEIKHISQQPFRQPYFLGENILAP